MSIPQPSDSLATLEKYPDESRLYAFDFSDVEEVANGASLILPVVTADLEGLVVGVPTVSDAQVLVQLSAGVAGRVYLLGCDVQTNEPSPSVLSMFVKLYVIDPSTL